MIEITAKNLRAALKAAVDLKGEDYIYVNPDGRVASEEESISCSYYCGDGSGENYGEPSCIFGHALMSMGITTAQLDWAGGSFIGMMLETLESKGWITPVSFEVKAAAYAAQQAQDNGKTWGEALGAFDRELAANVL